MDIPPTTPPTIAPILLLLLLPAESMPEVTTLPGGIRLVTVTTEVIACPSEVSLWAKSKLVFAGRRKFEITE
jgi:hypothetical protein